MRTLSAKDAKYGFGRLIDVARAAARHGRQIRASGRRGDLGGGIRAAEGARRGRDRAKRRRNGNEAEQGGRPLSRMDKRSLSERDICTKFITPALRGPDGTEMSQFREEVTFTAGASSCAAGWSRAASANAPTTSSTSSRTSRSQ